MGSALGFSVFGGSYGAGLGDSWPHAGTNKPKVRTTVQAKFEWANIRTSDGKNWNKKPKILSSTNAAVRSLIGWRDR
jgi:hypothetical protein